MNARVISARLAGIFAAVLLVVCFVGCGGGTKDKEIVEKISEKVIEVVEFAKMAVKRGVNWVVTLVVKVKGPDGGERLQRLDFDLTEQQLKDMESGMSKLVLEDKDGKRTVVEAPLKIEKVNPDKEK